MDAVASGVAGCVAMTAGSSVFASGSFLGSPLSNDERNALVRILGLACDDAYPLSDRRREALENYLRVVTCPPLAPERVTAAARNLIQTWSDSPSLRNASSSRPRQSKPDSVVVSAASPLTIGQVEVRRSQAAIEVLPRRRSQPILAELLELENTNGSTSPMSPTAIADVIRAYS
jgi:hypothetical protein